MTNKTVLLTRSSANERDQEFIEKFGINTVVESFTQVRVAPAKFGLELKSLMDESKNSKNWLIFLSMNSIKFFREIINDDSSFTALINANNLEVVCMGTGTLAELRKISDRSVLLPDIKTSDGIFSLLQAENPTQVFLPIGNLSNGKLYESLTKNGWDVRTAVVYINETSTKEPRSLKLIQNGEIDLVLLRSPSSAVALHDFLPGTDIPVFCGGLFTLAEAKSLGLNIVGSTDDPSPENIGLKVAQLLGHN